MFDANKDRRIYRYSSVVELSQFLFALITFLLLILEAFDIFNLAKVILSPTGLTISIAFTHISNFFQTLILVGVLLSFIYSLPSIEVKEQGLCLKSFPLNPIEIKWTDVSYVKQAWWKAILEKRKSSVIVAKNGLTFFHRLCGIVYGGTIKPAFVISSFISNYDELQKTISDNVKKSRRVVN